MESENLLIVNDTFLIDCCEARKKAFVADGDKVEELIHAENLPKILRHCPAHLGCIQAVVRK